MPGVFVLGVAELALPPGTLQFKTSTLNPAIDGTLRMINKNIKEKNLLFLYI